MRIKRTFFYIRKDITTPFYHEAINPNYVNEMRAHVKRIDARLDFMQGMYTDKIHYFSLYHETDDYELFKTVTHNLYYEGELKESFKRSMRYTKDNEIAFALAISKIDHPEPESSTLFEFYNVTPPNVRLIDASPHQKVALQIFNNGVRQPEFYSIINFFDYTHRVKHMQTRYLNVDDTFWKRFGEENREIYPSFMTDKQIYNDTLNIQYESRKIENTPLIDIPYYSSTMVNDFMPDSLKDLKLPIFI